MFGNFSIALDSSFTNYFMDKIFDKEKLISGNLLLNISTSNNLILLDGVIDNYNLKTENKNREFPLLISSTENYNPTVSEPSPHY